MELSIQDLYDNISIIHTDHSDWETDLARELDGIHLDSSIPFENIKKSTIEYHKCKSIVLEKEYVDADYLDEFCFFYSKLLANYLNKCTRLHFFKDKIDLKDLMYDLKSKSHGYIGFSVFRPTNSFQTGRTVIKPPFDDGKNNFILSKCTFEVNLSGNRLETYGMPFLQQDTNVNVCAHASLWMTSLYMHKKYNYPRFFPSQINDLANLNLVVGPVRIGLHHYQIIATLKQMGFAPTIFYTGPTPKDTAKIIYGYVESGIPVILLLSFEEAGHAVVAIGHDYIVKKKLKKNLDSNIDWIEHFYVNDDARGPYLKVPIRKKKEMYSIEKNVVGIVVPVPKEVTLQIDDVIDHTASIMKYVNELFQIFDLPEDYRFSNNYLKNLIFRTYLMKSNDFKMQLPNGMSEPFKTIYKSMRMHKYIWVVEVSKSNLINFPESENRKRIGEIIIDSTADRHSSFRSFLSIHLYGRMFFKKPEDKHPSGFALDLTEKPYNHLVRN